MGEVLVNQQSPKSSWLAPDSAAALRRWLFVIAPAISLAGFIFYIMSTNSDSATSLSPSDTMIVERGHKIYLRHCASCHGTNLEGQPNWRVRDANGYLPAPPHDQSGHTWHHADKQLIELTKFGTAKIVGGNYKSNMPAYQGILSDRQIVAVLSYIKSRWPENIQRRHDRLNVAKTRR